MPGELNEFSALSFFVPGGAPQRLYRRRKQGRCGFWREGKPVTGKCSNDVIIHMNHPARGMVWGECGAQCGQYGGSLSALFCRF